MVERLNLRGVELFRCEVCGLVYREERYAQMCERWCREHGTCNLEITRHAVGGWAKKFGEIQH